MRDAETHGKWTLAEISIPNHTLLSSGDGGSGGGAGAAVDVEKAKQAIAALDNELLTPGGGSGGGGPGKEAKPASLSSLLSPPSPTKGSSRLAGLLKKARSSVVLVMALNRIVKFASEGNGRSSPPLQATTNNQRNI
mgnify:CR=1 FL=1